ncbi:MAG TPA: ShlB/FhaC/HecB family hemolysin secretion/activation protein [Gallionella sp.]|nr:ShlB/FhaC/HecB family hemolysin secretion/activation protein [Gallionella sp.]
MERVDGRDNVRPQKPSFRPPAATSPLQLPPVVPLPEESHKISPQLRVYAGDYQFAGNTVVSSEELRQVSAPYTGRTVTSEELLELRNKLTLYYVNKGYVNSGAVLPDQEIKNNVVTFRIVEGTLNQIMVTGVQRLNVDYIRGRILLGSGPPLNVNSLQQRLLLLQQNGLIERINAELSPGTRQGESTLNVVVQEARPYQVGLTFSNHSSPSVGAYRAELNAAHRNLSGWGDTLEATYGITSGINDYSLRYALPLDVHDTTIGLRYSRNDAVVVEAPFNQLNITSRSQTIGVSLDRPLIQTLSETLSLGLSVEQRSSQTYLLDQPFSFTAGIVGGKSVENVLRFSQEWGKRSVDQVVTLRSAFSTGSTNALSTVNGGGPAKHFVAWLGQAQWAGRLERGHQFILLGNTQYAAQTLLPLEKLGIGGANTVRGYRETQLLRDNGFVISAEYRIPVFHNQAGESRTQLAPFVDYGKGWNRDLTSDIPRDISSIGLGLLWNPDKHWQAQLYAAKAFRHFPVSGKRDLQDSGIHFLLNYQLF